MKSKYLEFKCAKSPTGNDWYYVKRTNDKKDTDSAVAITTLVKINNEYNFLFLKTKRPPMYAEKKAKYCLESPAGLIADIDSNETLMQCAKKELMEEAGYISDNMYIELTNSSTSAGLSSETLTFITAIVNDNTQKQKPVSDGGIIADRVFVPCKNIDSFIQNIDKKEMSVSSTTICGIYFALKRIK